ncbi:MAG: transposase [Gelidibacter sp.]
MAKYQNKYRSESARATWWHYGWAGAYFITICTGNRDHYFGEIISEKSNKMILSNCGVLADIFWHEIKNHAKNVELGAFVVMPNHIHGILILTTDSVVGTGRDVVGTGHALSLQSPPPPQPPPQTLNEIPNKSIAQNRFQNQGKNTISSIVGSYKSAVTKHANRLGFEFGWQTRFHDHIIRNDAEYQRINNYIESNIDNWKNDKFF